MVRQCTTINLFLQLPKNIINAQTTKMLLNINPDNPQPRLIGQVVKALKNGAIICYPTDTGYGIGCDIYNHKAIKRIIQLKQRRKNKPFSFLCSDLRNISSYAHVANYAYRLLKKHLPGPYTFVLIGSKLVPKIMVTKQKTVGIRVPDNKICQHLIQALGNPIVNTSVALPDDMLPGSIFEIEQMLANRVEIIIDNGDIYSDPSSVIDLTGDYPIVIREGKGNIDI
jgi:tRNA threonylcarbamoyl adenosine modification protein (Sua5/YciO/YrdC/YwlC family)